MILSRFENHQDTLFFNIYQLVESFAKDCGVNCSVIMNGLIDKMIRLLDKVCRFVSTNSKKLAHGLDFLDPRSLICFQQDIHAQGIMRGLCAV